MSIETFLDSLSCRPERVSAPSSFSFLLTDVKIGSKKSIFDKSLQNKRYLPETVLFGNKYGGRKKDFDNIELTATDDNNLDDLILTQVIPGALLNTATCLVLIDS